MGDRERKPSQSSGNVEGREDASGGAHGQLKERAARRQRRDASGDAPNHWNATHPQLVERFNQLTEGACGNGVNIDVEKLRAWQREHGLEPDGKVGQAVIEAAEREQGKGDSEPAADEPHDVFKGEGVDEDSPVIKCMGAHTIDVITEGAKGQEKRGDEHAGETLSNAGTTVRDAREGIEVAHSAAINPTLEEGLGGEEEGESPWLKAAMAPAIVAMLSEGRYLDAVKTLAKSFTPTEYLAGLEFAAKKIGLEWLSKLFGRLAAGFAGTVANVLLLEYLWLKEGLEQIREAHESGDRDNRIRMYSSAFAEAFLYGEAASPRVRPVTAEEYEAVASGLREGRATAGSAGEMAPVIGHVLLQKFGDADNTRRAIIDALFVKAGMTGYRFHEGGQQ